MVAMNLALVGLLDSRWMGRRRSCHDLHLEQPQQWLKALRAFHSSAD
jgi:hypothetical protein